VGFISRTGRFGGTAGNEALTHATAGLLTVLLLAEGVTILDLGGLLSAHMFIGLALIPPVVLKLTSTGYRMVRYYTGSRPYREKGPPALPLRLLAPVLVAATLGVFSTGVWLLLLGHGSDTVLLLHKASFIAWGAAFGVHFLAYVPRVLQTLRESRRAASRRRVPGAGLRALSLAAALGGGLVLAVAVLDQITSWHGG
jgi:hypothetical protein